VKNVTPLPSTGDCELDRSSRCLLMKRHLQKLILPSRLSPMQVVHVQKIPSFPAPAQAADVDGEHADAPPKADLDLGSSVTATSNLCREGSISVSTTTAIASGRSSTLRLPIASLDRMILSYLDFSIGSPLFLQLGGYGFRRGG